MAAKGKKPSEIEPGSIDELTRIIALALKYQGIPQGVLVHDLSKAGFQPGRIAALLNTTSNTVSQQKREKRPQWPRKEASNG